MPVIQVENRVGLDASLKARLATEITDVVREVIRSPMDLISVVFHDLPEQNTYRSGDATGEALIFCHIRAGRSDEAIRTLLARVSATWSRLTGDPEDCVELVVAQYPARHTMRGGELLPEPPRV